jgi:hypothetical protein
MKEKKYMFITEAPHINESLPSVSNAPRSVISLTQNYDYFIKNYKPLRKPSLTLFGLPALNILKSYGC